MEKWENKEYGYDITISILNCVRLAQSDDYKSHFGTNF